MNDHAQPNGLTPPIPGNGEVKPVATRRARSKSAASPLAAYRSVSFVCDYKAHERLDGDKRLEVDLCARLADGLDLPCHFFTREDKYEKDAKDKTLYIAVNSQLPQRLNPVTVCINNDCNNYMDNGDFYFEPFFLPFAMSINETFPENAHVYPINSLPSRVTSQNIADELRKNPFNSDGKPVIALMFRNPEWDDLTAIKQIAETLQQKHQARFLISTGPRSYISKEEEIQKTFKDLDGVQIFLWELSYGAENPYLWMLGAATHVVTTGTISTTSDLLATGKPVYYTDIKPLCSEDKRLQVGLLSRKVVDHFDAEMLDRKPPSEDIRRKYQEAWSESSKRFCGDLNLLLAKRNKQATFGQKLIASLSSRVKKAPKKKILLLKDQLG